MISDRQHRALLEVIGEANGAADREEFRVSVLPGVRRLVPADFASYNEVAEDGTVHAAIADPELAEEHVASWVRLAGQNPLLQRFARTRDGRPYRFSDVVSREQLEALELYRELYVPLGVRYQIALCLPSPRWLTIAIALSRGRTDFTEGERELLALLRPHLIQAYRNAKLRGQTSVLLEGLRSGLDAHGMAAIVLDEEGVVVYATEPTRRWVDAREGEPLPALPKATPDGDTLLHTRTGAVVFLERASRVLTPAALEDIGLTPAEARVLAGLAAGRSTDEVAADHGLSPRTVLKHSERIHRKLGVRDRAQAIATAWAATEADGRTRSRVSPDDGHSRQNDGSEAVL